VIRLPLHNALRVDEACAASVTDLGTDAGHRVLRVVRKGARKAKVPLTPATVAALDAYRADRGRRAGLGDVRQLTGPLLATAVKSSETSVRTKSCLLALAYDNGTAGQSALDVLVNEFPQRHRSRVCGRQF